MKYREVSSFHRWHVDARRSRRHRVRREKHKRQMRDRFPKFRPVRPVPGINFIERFERRAFRVGHSNQLEASVGDGPGLIGKTDERQRHPRRPDLGVVGLRGLKRGQRQNNVANGARTDQ